MAEFAIGVDLGATKIEAALIDRAGSLLDLARVPTDHEDGAEIVMVRVIACIDQLMDQVDEDEIAGIGVGTPGVIDIRNGTVVIAGNLGWRNLPMRRVIAGLLGAVSWERRVWLDNDTNVAVLGEFYYGAGQNARHMLYVTIGTGVGSGMILDGRLYRGATGGAGEIGHIVLDPEGRHCSCGRRGCLETLISGPSIVYQARALLERGMPSSLDHTALDSLSAIDVVSAAQTGDWLARSVLENAGVYLGMVLAHYIEINNPELIIVGGGVGAAAGELMLASAREVIEARTFPSHFEAMRITLPALGGSSGAMGAAALVWYEMGILPDRLTEE
ncbi:MAG: ROK family protein [Anaerolineae bacterium]|nr:ROK family protein [Anaerolineae bacterium]